MEQPIVVHDCELCLDTSPKYLFLTGKLVKILLVSITVDSTARAPALANLHLILVYLSPSQCLEELDQIPHVFHGDHGLEPLGHDGDAVRSDLFDLLTWNDAVSAVWSRSHMATTPSEPVAATRFPSGANATR